jgi:chromosome segregation ATPase
MNTTNKSTAQRSFGAAVRHILQQVGRLLEEEDPGPLLEEGAALRAALRTWQQTIETQTSGIEVQRARELENEKLVMMAKAARLEKEQSDLVARNQELRQEIVRLHKRETEMKQQLMQTRFEGSGVKADREVLDLEIRDLRRRVRELEGGPPLTPAEAAPQYGQREELDQRLAAEAPLTGARRAKSRVKGETAKPSRSKEHQAPAKKKGRAVAKLSAADGMKTKRKKKGATPKSPLKTAKAKPAKRKAAGRR